MAAPEPPLSEAVGGRLVRRWPSGQDLACDQPVDTLYILDASLGMEKYISAAARRAPAFAAQIAHLGLTGVRVGVVGFGGAARVVLPFTTDVGELASVMYRMANATGPAGGWGDQEAGLETLRSVLASDASGAVPASEIGPACDSQVPVSECVLAWRPDALRSIVMFTDEDSDLPVQP
nr:hypothetical protein HK105_001702 [Polyrhizophydium stewartii]